MRDLNGSTKRKVRRSKMSLAKHLTAFSTPVVTVAIVLVDGRIMCGKGSNSSVRVIAAIGQYVRAVLTLAEQDSRLEHCTDAPVVPRSASDNELVAWFFLKRLARINGSC